MNALEIIEIITWIIICLKIIFIASTLLHKYVSHNKKSNLKKYDDKLVYLRDLSEFIFVVLMCLILIFVFHPRQEHNKYLNKEMRFLIYLFGWIILLTADWSEFFSMIDVRYSRERL